MNGCLEARVSVRVRRRDGTHSWWRGSRSKAMHARRPASVFCGGAEQKMRHVEGETRVGCEKERVAGELGGAVESE